MNDSKCVNEPSLGQTKLGLQFEICIIYKLEAVQTLAGKDDLEYLNTTCAEMCVPGVTAQCK